MFKSQSLLTRRAMFCRTGRSVALCSLKKTILREISQVKDPLIVLLRQNYECTQRSSCRGGSRGRVQGCAGAGRAPPGFLIQLVFCKKKTMWFIGVEVEQETSAPPPNPRSAPVQGVLSCPVHGAREVWERVKAQARVQVRPSRKLWLGTGLECTLHSNAQNTVNRNSTFIL